MLLKVKSYKPKKVQIDGRNYHFKRAIYLTRMKRNLFMSKRQKVIKHHKHRKCYAKNKRSNLKIFGSCKRCCFILSLFVSHLVVCGCSHSEVNPPPCKRYLGPHYNTFNSGFNSEIKDSNTIIMYRNGELTSLVTNKEVFHYFGY